jgi:hypothetical protein
MVVATVASAGFALTLAVQGKQSAMWGWQEAAPQPQVLLA